MLSGGVDSAVAAWRLQQEGWMVEGVFMKNWTPLSSQTLTDCPWERDQEDAAAVAACLDIPFQSLNFEVEYRQKVVDYLLAEYRAGRTPNPDVLCNREIKFGLFMDWALAHGFTHVASGHYAQIGDLGGHPVVQRGLDQGKDQSYFLWAVGGELLQRVLLPVGGLQKAEVRRLAAEAGLPVATKPDSQGICFIGHLSLSDWLKEELQPEPGEVVTLSGRVIGHHDGAILYTIGQRHGFTITDKAGAAAEYDLDKAQLPRLFVVRKEENKLVVAAAAAETAVRQLWLTDVVWHVPTDTLTDDLSLQARYRQSPRPVASWETTVDGVLVNLAEPINAPAPGQFGVFYAGNSVVGGGVIHRTEKM
jgi:tRNA-specific 2-thiouridylase